MVGLLRRHPNLYCDTAAHHPRYFGVKGSGWEQFLQFGNTLLQDKVMVGLSLGIVRPPLQGGDRRVRGAAAQGARDREVALRQRPAVLPAGLTLTRSRRARRRRPRLLPRGRTRSGLMSSSSKRPSSEAASCPSLTKRIDDGGDIAARLTAEALQQRPDAQALQHAPRPSRPRAAPARPRHRFDELHQHAAGADHHAPARTADRA